ncbi:FAD-dependent oxidoreductase [Paraburkholderia flagellata]|uniref:FAD-dependent oxidoreductase n=1 Tax=Paraburkholderia flagellata TaxID=2883241 RepID=UPI001F2F6F58|nr:FAD-dependent oxidoreductase [Paraburkholderia flagellata]
MNISSNDDLASTQASGALSSVARTKRPEEGLSHMSEHGIPRGEGPVSPESYEIEEAAQRTQVELRRYQMYPVLSATRLNKIARFGERRSWQAGETIFRTGEPSKGMHVLVRGRVRIVMRDALDRSRSFDEIVEGQFLGETATLSGKPYLVEAHAVTDVEMILVSPPRLRSLMIAEAQLGSELMRAFILRRVAFIQDGSGPILVGAPSEPKFLALADLLRRVNHPHRVIDPSDDQGAEALRGKLEYKENDLPIAMLVDGRVLRNADATELASALGIRGNFDEKRTYDLVIVGAGPAGLAAAVYAASEGLAVLVLDSRGFGGQAGASSRIENYMGFPTGISGHVLVSRAFEQAVKFGADIVIQSEVVKLDCASIPFRIHLSDDRVCQAKTVIIATGASYSRPDIRGLNSVCDLGVYYWASSIEGRLCRGEEIVLVGGGNSAGQAIVFLASYASRIHVVIRRDGLQQTMSHYLMQRVSKLSNVTIHIRSTVEDVEDVEGETPKVTLNKDGGRLIIRSQHLFLFTGAKPSTRWLSGCGVKLDEKDFIMTGPLLHHSGEEHHFAYETSVPGIFAVGDVRSCSTKRVASAVGEGAAVVAEVHSLLASES